MCICVQICDCAGHRLFYSINIILYKIDELIGYKKNEIESNLIVSNRIELNGIVSRRQGEAGKRETFLKFSHENIVI